MTSTYTTRNRFNLQADGDNTNTWGDVMNAGVFSVLDAALDGWTYLTPAGPTTLTTVNGGADQARSRGLKFQPGSVATTTTVPALEKLYYVWNASSAAQTIASSGGGSSVVVQPAEVIWVGCDSVNMVRSNLVIDGTSLTVTGPLTTTGAITAGGAIQAGGKVTNVTTGTASTDAVNVGQMNTAIGAAAFSVGTFGVPIVAGNAGQLLTNNGSTPSWSNTFTGGFTFGSVTVTGALGATGALTVGGLATLAAAGLQWASARGLTDNALAADVRAGSSAAVAVTPNALMASSAFQTLTDAATIAWNVANGYNATVTLTASGHTVGNPTGLVDGQTISLEIVQGAGGSFTVSWGSLWDFGAGGLPTLQTAAGKADRIFGQYNARTGKIECSYRKGA